MTGTLPTSFEDLDAGELYRTALEDFAVEVDEAHKGQKKVLLAALLESNIKWADYVAQHPEVKPEEVAVTRPGAVVTTKSFAEPVADQEVEIITQKELPVNTVQKHLIKMTRDNPLFQIHGYTFTQDNPYHLVDPDTANKILREDGFELARPDEVQEYYS